MSESMDIEDTVIDDVKALLVAKGLTTHIEGENLGKSPDYSVGRVAVGASVAGPSLVGGQMTAGFPRVALTITCETHKAKDKAGATLRALAKSVREVIQTEELIDNLTNESTRATYYAWQVGPTFRDDMDRIANLVMTYTLILRPSQ